ncbi:MAG: hypothetical protein LBB54_06055 [Cellulomonadaceae bacterium]|jgi:hypothetical protein|nr:hypothetical protein [Cellulomonadaceae bacterium]
MVPALTIVKGAPDDLEVAALVAGLAAVAANQADPFNDVAPIPAWTDRARGLHRNAQTATAKSFGGRNGRHNADAWRWSLRG